MSEHDDELELQALQRELDDAFATTRPRRGFEDELWTRVQARRPAGVRLGDALAGLLQGIREVPAVPAAAVAVVLVLALGVGLFSLSGLGRGGGATSNGAVAPAAQGGQAGGDRGLAAGQFGRLPSPQFASSAGPPAAVANPGASTPYFGPATLTWSGKLTLSTGSAPVYRYREPSSNAADEFASSLGTTLVDRPSGFLGAYQSSDYTLKVRGSVQTPPQGPAYFILSAPTIQPISTAGSAPADIAVLFLASHSLVPDWIFTTDVGQGSGGLTRVRLLRQFPVPAYGAASLVDVNGDRSGIEIDLDGGRVALVSGPLPVAMDAASYPIVQPDQAIAPLLAGAPAPAGAPTVNLTRAELVYVFVPAGDHSFYEPAYLFSGTFQSGGTTYEKRVLVAAVDPSQRA